MVKRVFLLLGFLLLGVTSVYAQEVQNDPVLEKELQEIIDDFKGVAGVYVYNLATKKEAGIYADTVFPTASIVKVPILAALFQKIENGELSLTDSLSYNKERIYGGSGLMQFYKDSTITDLRNVVALMITYSDNVASLWSQELAGGGEEINKIMNGIGLEHTRVNSRTKGREDIWEKYGWGQTTPREMASILVKIRNRELVSEAASDEMYRLLSNSFYTEYSLSQIPPYVQAASKQGMVNQSRSELVMVNAPNGDFVFYIATKDNEDESWKFDNEAWVLQRKISSFLWNYFEPDAGWKPAKDSEALIQGLDH